MTLPIVLWIVAGRVKWNPCKNNIRIHEQDRFYIPTGSINRQFRLE